VAAGKAERLTLVLESYKVTYKTLHLKGRRKEWSILLCIGKGKRKVVPVIN